MKKFASFFALLTFMTLMVVACGNGGSSSGSSGSSGGITGSNTTDVHMNATNFVQSSVTIRKGGSLNLIDDTAVVHVITNGTWVNGTAQLKQEPGAPRVNNVTFNGNDSNIIGPFNTAGTYHLLCTVHPGMNLTVTVQ